MEKPPGLVFNLLAATWWVCVGAGALYFLTYKPTELPPPKPAQKQTLRVEDSKAIGPNEELRVIWMPSSIDAIGYRCLLYINKETGASSMACDDDINFE